jgi:hypothetical protein
MRGKYSEMEVTEMLFEINPPNGETIPYFLLGKGYEQEQITRTKAPNDFVLAVQAVGDIPQDFVLVAGVTGDCGTTRAFIQVPDQRIPCSPGSEICWYLVSKENASWACPGYRDYMMVA